MAKFIGWLIVLALDIPAIIFRGFVLASLWLWFIVPLGLSPIGKAHAIGIAILIALLTKNPNAAEKGDNEDGALAKAFGRQIGSVLVTLTSWGFGALVASYM